MRWIGRIVAVLMIVVAMDFAIGVAVGLYTRAYSAPRSGALLRPAAYSMASMAPDPAVSNPVIRILPGGFRYVPGGDLDGRPIIAVLGGSFAYGGGAVDSDYYLAHLQAAMPDFCFVNAACQSYVARQQLVRFVLDVLPLRPYAVLILDGYNDLALPLIWRNPPGQPWQWENYADMLSTSRLRMIRGYLKFHSNFYRFYSRFSMRSTRVPPNLIRDVKREYASATMQLHQICRQFNIRCFHAVQPHLSIGKPMSTAESRMVTPAIAAALQDLYPHIVVTAHELCDRNNIPFLDLTTIFASHPETLYSDLCHLTPAGHAILAKRLEFFLKGQCL